MDEKLNLKIVYKSGGFNLTTLDTSKYCIDNLMQIFLSGGKIHLQDNRWEKERHILLDMKEVRCLIIEQQ